MKKTLSFLVLALLIVVGAQVSSARISNPPASGLSALTPWTENINGGGYSLSNVLAGAFTTLTATTTFQVATTTVTENMVTIQATTTKDLLEGYSTTGTSRFLFKGTGGISTCESVLATSTSMTIDWTLCPTQIARLSTAAVTIAVSNNHVAGQSITLETCAPPTGTMGAITFTGVDWANQTVPTQTTTANNCDLWGFKPITATSTLVIHGAQTPKF